MAERTWRAGRLAAVLWTAAAAGAAPAADAPQAQAQAQTQLVVFGDSYSDSGNENGSQAVARALLQPRGPVPVDPVAGQTEVPDPAHYWQGHWSNGPTAVEALAARLGMPLLDFAAGGAMTGEGNYYGWMDAHRATGLLGQVQGYRQWLDGHRPPATSLHLVFAGSNDLFHAIDTAPQVPAGRSGASAMVPLADRAAGNVLDAVRALAAMGAQRVVVLGVPDLALLPWARGMNSQSKAGPRIGFTGLARRFGERFNGRLAADLPSLGRQLGIDLRYFDVAAALAQVRADAPRAGLKELDRPCQPGSIDGNFAPACTAPDTVFFWDEYHLTARASALLAERVEAFLNPSAAVPDPP